MNIRIILLFLTISAFKIAPTYSLPQAPTTIAIQDWQGYTACIAQVALSSYIGSKFPDAMTYAFSKIPTEGWKGSLASPLSWTLHKLSSIDRSYTGAAAGLSGAILAYLFWYQITESKQKKRAKKFFGNYLTHEVAVRSIDDRRILAAALARECPRGKAIDEQTLIQALVEISSRIQIGLDMIEAALRVDPENEELKSLKADALNALHTLIYNQTLISIEHGKDYRDARRATAEEMQAQAQDRMSHAQNSMARTARGYLILEFGKFIWSIAKIPLKPFLSPAS